MDAASDESNKGFDDGAQEMPAAVGKRYNSFIGRPHPLTGGWTRSGRTKDHGTSSITLSTAGCRGKPPDPRTVQPMFHVLILRISKVPNQPPWVRAEHHPGGRTGKPPLNASWTSKPHEESGSWWIDQKETLKDDLQAKIRPALSDRVIEI